MSASLVGSEMCIRDRIPPPPPPLPLPPTHDVPAGYAAGRQALQESAASAQECNGRTAGRDTLGAHWG
eukprot:11819665-Alexandrium_andersonii.AAC.1